MAEIVDDLPVGRRVPFNNEWLDGRCRLFVRGVDFNTDPYKRSVTLRATASKKGLYSRIRIDGDKLYFQAVPKEQK